MVSRFVPSRISGFMMGAYFVATGIAQYLGSVVATLASVPEAVTNPRQTLALYTRLFFGLGVVAVGGTVIATALVPLMRRLARRARTTEPRESEAV